MHDQCLVYVCVSSRSAIVQQHRVYQTYWGKSPDSFNELTAETLAIGWCLETLTLQVHIEVWTVLVMVEL